MKIFNIRYFALKFNFQNENVEIFHKKCVFFRKFPKIFIKKTQNPEKINILENLEKLKISDFGEISLITFRNRTSMTKKYLKIFQKKIFGDSFTYVKHSCKTVFDHIEY